jgi:carboxylesterase type B
MTDFGGVWCTAGTPALYSYLFAHPAKETGIPGASGIFVPHASEIEFVFGISPPFVSAEEGVLSNQMANYWIQFSKNGNPSYPSDGKSSQPAPIWPPYTTATDGSGDMVMRLQLGSEGGLKAVQHLRKAACDLMDRIHQHGLPPAASDSY